MRRFGRILLTAATILSLAVAVAALVLWVRSYHISETFTFSRKVDRPPTVGNTYWYLYSGNGGIGVSVRTTNTGLSDWDFGSGFEHRSRPVGADWYPGSDYLSWNGVEALGWRWRGFLYYHVGAESIIWKVIRQGGSDTGVTVPAWFAALAGAVLPGVLVLRRAGRRHARQASLCTACGYDVRATPDRYPECGLAQPSNAPAVDTWPAAPSGGTLTRVRRSLRILLNALTVFALLLCVAVVVLWVRSYWVGGTLVRQEVDGVARYVHWSRGRLSFAVCRNTLTPERASDYNLIWAPPPPGVRYEREDAAAVPAGADDLDPTWKFFRPTADRAWAGFRYRTGMVGFGACRQWALPFWAVAGFFAVPGLTGVLRAGYHVRSWRRRRACRCPACGYDLRATPDRCPECGAIPPPAAQQPRTAAPP